MNLPTLTRLLSFTPLAFGALSLSGCLNQGTLEDDLSDAVLAAWATEGVTFLGYIGSQPISAVEVTGDRTRTITYPDPEALGGEVIWDLEVVRVEAYPLFPGGSFSQALNDRAVAANRRNGIPATMRDQVDRGQILAIGEFQLHASRRGRAGEVPFQRVAVLESRGAQEDPVWVFEQEDRNHIVLWRATKVTYDFLMTQDDRVMSCTANAEGTAPREIRRECAIQAMEMEFGEEG